jgi:oxygen-independent coproporphyrinogen-3 oxidase
MTEILNIGLYFHIPFCQHRCDYCDFNTYAGMETFIPSYVEAVGKEVGKASSSIHELLGIESIYFGGGTPSIIPLSNYVKMIRLINQSFTVFPDAEITMEVNPGTVNEKYLVGLASLGINRLSIGMQSAHADELELLGRIHTLKDTLNTVRWVQQAGFSNINLDLIYGLPGQKIHDWQISLETALEHTPQHLSLYSLTLHENTIMARKIKQGIIHPIDDDFSADCYEFAMDFLGENGFQQYEISNWFKAQREDLDYRSIHNLRYWRRLPYLGFGAGAHSFFKNLRWENPQKIEAYIERSEGKHGFPLTRATVNLSRKDEMSETMMLGLRLTSEGISDHNFRKQFNVSMIDVYGGEITELLDLGLVEWSGEDQSILRLTRRGRLLGNQVFMEFV